MSEEHFSVNKQLVLLTVVLPILLVGVGCWEWLRSGSVDISSANFYTIQPLLLALQKPLAATVILCGLLAAGTGSWGLLSFRAAGQRALASREELLSGFEAGLRKLPVVLVGVGIGISVAVACVMLFELISFFQHRPVGQGEAKLVAVGVLLALALMGFGIKLVWKMYRTSRAVFEPGSSTMLGRCLSREEAPKVWAMVEDVARRVGAAMPDCIVVGLEEGFFVTEGNVELYANSGRQPKGRMLYLPLPYMAYMTRKEVEAVIGHELGHFTGEDTEYSLRFTPIYQSAIHRLQTVWESAEQSENDTILGLVAKPSLLLGEYYLDSFHLAVRHWSRVREFAADQMAAKTAGADAAAAMLLRICSLMPHVEQALHEYWDTGGRLEGGIMGRVRELVRTEGLTSPATHLEDVQTHPTDTHPPVGLRIEAWGVPLSPELEERVTNPQESSLLWELGLEEAPPAGVSGSASAAAEKRPEQPR